MRWENMKLLFENDQLIFKNVELIFNNTIYKDVFAGKNNKSLSETLEHIRYQKLGNLIYNNYSEFFDWSLGKFLLMLKNKNDLNYKLFLNKYGDLTYSHFWIDD
jgi:hypothetical protein